MKSNYKRLGDFIRPVDERNVDGKVKRLLGVSIEKRYIESIANTIGTDMDIYKIVKTNQFAYGPVTSRNGDKISVALLKEKECIVSSSYSVFEVIDDKKLLPDFLMLWFRRSEFDRYARYHSHGSTREIFNWDAMYDVMLPVPSLDEQKKIVDAYNAIENRIALKRKINDNLEAQAYNIFKPIVAQPLDDFFSCKMLDLPVEITDFVANGSFASLNENVTLYDEPNFAYYLRNTDLKSNTYTKFVDATSYKFLSKSVLNGGEVIISNVADVGSVYLCPVLNKPMTLGSNVIMLKSNNNLWSIFLYLYFKYSKGKEQIVEITTGSAQPKFNKTAFRNLDLLVPNHTLLVSFNNNVSSIFAIIEQNNSELRMLNELESSFLQSISRH